MTDYDKLKVADLKDLVKERGIATTGLKLKQQYIDALLAHDSSAETANTEHGDDGEHDAAESDAVEETRASGAEHGQGGSEVHEAETGNGEAESLSATDGDDEVTNKRKRRSPTPSVREASVSKKLKTMGEETEADVEVELPKDVVTDAPVATEELDESSERIMPYGSGDDIMDVTEDHAATGEVNVPPSQAPTAQQESAMEDIEMTGPPPKHAPTRALYIRELVRPLQPHMLREHLLLVAQPTDSSSPSTIEVFHLDKLRSHALVSFDSRSAAIRARTALHGQTWPDEPMRRTLWVDFVPEERVHDWINEEVQRADMTRWEVIYTTDEPVTAIHQQADQSPSTSRKQSQMVAPTGPPPGAGEGMPNAPSGPRRRSPQAQAPPTPQEPPVDESSHELDVKFSFTESKPKIYFKPVSEQLVEKRLSVFDQETSQDWDDSYADPSAYAEGELRRYTFEDGDRLVDGGADFGLFGRRSTRGGARGGGRGRGGPGGDYYRGGPRRR